MMLSSWTAELAAKLHLPAGECFQRFYAFVPWWLLTTLVGLAVSVAAWRALRPAAERHWSAGSAPLGGWRDVAAVGVVGALVVASFDGSGFLHGFFRQDDFSFLQVAREDSGLFRQLLLFHNDHGYPLYRLEVWLLVQLAGPAASAGTLAAWFNAMNFVTCVSVVASACWLLHELGTSRGSVFVLPLLVWFWPGWGEFTAGYYTLGAYLQVLTASFVAAAALVRGMRGGSPGWLVASLVGVAIASAIDTSGLSVFGTVTIVGVGWLYAQNALARHRGYWLALGALLVVSAGFYFGLGHHAYSARELVQNPRGASLHLSDLIGDLLAHPTPSLIAALTWPGSLALAFLSPTFTQLLFVLRGPGSTIFTGLVVGEIIATLAVVALGRRAWRRLASEDRPLVLALAANALAGLGMVLLARNHYATTIPTVLWPSKYLAIPMAWACIAVAFFADRALRPWRLPKLAGMAFFTLVAGVWLTLSYRACERTVLPAAHAYVARGRWGNVHNAIVRRELHQALMKDLAEIAQAQNSTRIRLPDWQTWAPAFYARYRCLEWGCDYTPDGVTHLFWDFPAASLRHGLTGVFVPAGEFSPEMAAHLSRYAWLDGAFPLKAGELASTASNP